MALKRIARLRNITSLKKKINKLKKKKKPTPPSEFSNENSSLDWKLRFSSLAFSDLNGQFSVRRKWAAGKCSSKIGERSISITFYRPLGSLMRKWRRTSLSCAVILRGHIREKRFFVDNFGEAAVFFPNSKKLKMIRYVN